jgi:formylglycine-generating enzyme required for sulfatase activity
VLLANWGPVTSTALSRACDLDSSGQVDGADLGMLLANWGACPIPTWGTVIEAQPDPDVVTDANLRAAIQATGLPWRVRDNGTGIEMLLIPPGTFQMGCSASSNWECSDSELPLHGVTLTNPFYLGRYEVTQAQWTAKMGSNPSRFQGYADSSSRPVEQVSWNDALGFVQSFGGRLPTEAEWEYACRAGTQSAFYDGSNDDAALLGIAWVATNCGGEIRPVGGRLPNGFGCHDMLGNAWEWVADRFGPYQAGQQVDPIGPAIGGDRVARGHTFGDGSYNNCRSSSRDWGPATTRHAWTGFRVARNP